MNKSVYLESIFLVFLFVFSLYLWSAPIRSIPMPYGEVDSAHHYGITDYITETDRIEEQVYKPAFLYYGYSFRSTAGPGKIGTESPYTHNFFINEAIAQVMGGDRPISYFLFLTISCISIVFSLYFLIRKLFGILPAALASILVVLSKIDIMTFIMGQYVILVSFACTPLILYCYYKYTTSISENQPRPIYLYIMSFLVATQYFNHFQSLIDTFLILMIFTSFLLIKSRTLPFRIKHSIISIILLLIILGPFIGKSLSSVRSVSSDYNKEHSADVSTNWGDLFRWYTSGYSAIAVSQSMFSYGDMHGLWTLPLLLLGVIFLVLRRNRKDLLLLSWLIALYIILHFDLFLGWGASRLLRSVNEVPYIFYTLIGVGTAGIASFIKMPEQYKKYPIYAVTIVFLILVFSLNFKSSYEMLDKAYSLPYRINPYQYEAAVWVNDNLPEDSFIYGKGTLIDKTTRFMRSVSHRYISEAGEEDLQWQQSIHPGETIKHTHTIIDYSELVMFGLKDQIASLQQWEKNNLANSTKIYSKNNIIIYKVNED